MYPGPLGANGRAPNGVFGVDASPVAQSTQHQIIVHPPRWDTVKHYDIQARLVDANNALRHVLDRLEGFDGPLPTPRERAGLELRMKELSARVERLISELRGHRGRHVA